MKEANKRGFNEQLKEHFKARESRDANSVQDEINKSLASQFDQWLKDDESADKREPFQSKALREAKKKQTGKTTQGAAVSAEPPVSGILAKMESRRIYDMLSMRQKKEIAWLLREDGLV